MDVLKRENELLRDTIQESSASVKDLEGKAAAANIAAPAGKTALLNENGPVGSGKMGADDYWTPAVTVPDGVEYKDEYGAISPIPDHDGTECFKWDNTLWSAAEHFRYRWNVFKGFRAAIDQNEGGLDKFTQVGCVPWAMRELIHGLLTSP